MRFSFLFILFVFSVFCLSAESAVIELKSGRIIEGEIIEKNDRDIKVDTGVGFLTTYYINEIKKIVVSDDSVVDEAPSLSKEKQEFLSVSERVKIALGQIIEELKLKISEISQYIQKRKNEPRRVQSKPSAIEEEGKAGPRFSVAAFLKKHEEAQKKKN